MRRWIALGFGALSVVVALARPVAAVGAPTPAAPSTTAGGAAAVPADAVGISFPTDKGASDRLDVALDAGASQQQAMVVANHTADLRLTVRLTATDATGAPGAGPAGWLAFGESLLVIEPGATVTVPLTVAVPHDTQPGPELAHVVASVDAATAASDGSPRAGSASSSVAVALTVNGAPSAQLAIVDVHRADSHGRHALAIQFRNFGDRSAHVDGHVRVAGDKPQTLSFHADLPARSDTAVMVPWDAPSASVATDVEVDADYGGNTASWSSSLGGSPVTVVTSPSAGTNATPTTAAASVTEAPTVGRATGAGWSRLLAPLVVVLVLVASAVWFALELTRSRRRRIPTRAVLTVGDLSSYTPVGAEQSSEFARQLAALADAITGLTGRLDAPTSTRTAAAPPPAPASPPRSPEPDRPVRTTPRRAIFGRATRRVTALDDGPARPAPAVVRSRRTPPVDPLPELPHRPVVTYRPERTDLGPDLPVRAAVTRRPPRDPEPVIDLPSRPVVVDRSATDLPLEASLPAPALATRPRTVPDSDPFAWPTQNEADGFAADQERFGDAVR